MKKEQALEILNAWLPGLPEQYDLDGAAEALASEGAFGDGTTKWCGACAATGCDACNGSGRVPARPRHNWQHGRCIKCFRKLGAPDDREPCDPEPSRPQPAQEGAKGDGRTYKLACTKARAEEIAMAAIDTDRPAPLRGARAAIDALDRAGLFMSEEAAAEIETASRTVFDHYEPDRCTHAGWRALAYRLASALRAAGLAGKDGAK